MAHFPSSIHQADSAHIPQQDQDLLLWLWRIETKRFDLANAIGNNR
jgi:hypothetical protein